MILWSDNGARLTHNTGAGADILGGAVKRDDTASDALYFKVQVDPLSDVASEPYAAALQLFESDQGRLAVGNAEEAWGYSAFATAETLTIRGLNPFFIREYVLAIAAACNAARADVLIPSSSGNMFWPAATLGAMLFFPS